MNFQARSDSSRSALNRSNSSFASTSERKGSICQSTVSPEDFWFDIRNYGVSCLITNAFVVVAMCMGVGSSWFFLGQDSQDNADCYLAGIEHLEDSPHNEFMDSLVAETGGHYYGRSAAVQKSAFGLMCITLCFSAGTLLALVLLNQVFPEVSGKTCMIFSRYILLQQLVCTCILIVAPVLFLVYWSANAQVLSCVKQVEPILINGNVLSRGSEKLEDESDFVSYQAFLGMAAAITQISTLYLASKLNATCDKHRQGQYNGGENTMEVPASSYPPRVVYGGEPRTHTPAPDTPPPPGRF